MKKPRSKRRANRIVAVQFLYSWEVNRPENLARDLFMFFEGQTEERDYYSFGEELIHKTIENIEKIDDRIRSLTTNWDFERIAKIDLAILRLAICEILFRHDIPPIVSINEAVDLAKTLSNLEATRFINGILDKLKDQLDRPLRQASNE